MPSIPPSAGDRARTDRGSLPLALALSELLDVGALKEATVLAGESGLHRRVTRVVVDHGDGSSVSAEQGLVLLPADRASSLSRGAGLVEELDEAGAAGLGIQRGLTAQDDLAPLMQHAEHHGFPVLDLSPSWNLDEVADEVVSQLLDEQAHRLARSQAVHRTLIDVVLQGHGLSELCETLSSFVGLPTALVDVDGAVLAAANLDELDLDANERIEIVSRNHARASGRDLTSTAVPVSGGLRLHGHVVAFGADRVALDRDRFALEHAATVAALVIAKDLEIRAVEDKYRSDLMHDLLFHVDDRDDVLRRATSFGWNIQRRLIVMVVRLDDPPEVVVPDEVTRRPALAKALRAQVLERDPEAAVVEFNREVVILMAAFDGKRGRVEAGAFARRILSEVSRVLGATVSAGQSRPVTDLEDIRLGYTQASSALRVGREVYGRGTVQHFLDLGTYRLLSQVQNAQELEAFAREILGPLWSDEDDARSMGETLQILFEENCNAASAARRLHFHYNTLRHRIARLESMVGPFMSDHRIRLDVQVALLIKSMKGLHLDD